MNDAIPQFMPPHTGEIPNHGQDRYAAHAPPTYSPPEFGFEEEKPPGYSFEDKFVVKQPTYNDVWAAVLFILHLLGLATITVLSIRGNTADMDVMHKGNGMSDLEDREPRIFGVPRSALILCGIILGVSFLLSGLYFWAARIYTKQVIYATAIFNILISLVGGVYLCYRRQYGSGLLLLVVAGISAFCFWSWRPRIPFAVVMLQTVMDVAQHFGHIYIVSFIGGIVAMLLGAWVVITASAVFARHNPDPPNSACQNGSCSKGKLLGLLVYVMFSGFWTSEFLKNTIHMTVSGVYGSWYFCSRAAEGMPKGATRGALKRTMTYSFGSVSFGSLIVSLIQLLKQMSTLAQSQSAEGGHLCGAILFCANCLISLVEWAVQYLNHYALSLIALYGKPYTQAARDTWRMMKDRGLDILVNDALIDPVLSMGAILIGFLCLVFAFLYLQVTRPAYNNDGSYMVIILVLSFLAGFQMGNIVLNPLKSGVSTLFVCIAWDPAVLQRDHQDLYARIAVVYPGVQHVLVNV